MPACAFLTMDDAADFVVYDGDAVGPLAALGWTVDEVPWRSGADWSRWDVVVVRSPWDYQDAPSDFFDVLADVDRQTRLENPLAVMRWNLQEDLPPRPGGRRRPHRPHALGRRPDDGPAG